MDPRSTGIVLTLTFGTLGAACTDAESGAEASMDATAEVPEGFVDAGDDVRLFYRTVGSAGDTLVVVHGGPAFDMEYFAADLEPLADGMTLLFYDQRGAGRSSLVSDSAQLDAERFADDLEAVRTHFDFDRMTILGHSWGAGVAGLYAMRHPERVERLLIVGGVPPRRQQLVDAFQDMAASRDSAEQRSLGERYEAHLADPGDIEACHAYIELWFRPFFADTAAASRTRGDFCAGTPEAIRNGLENVGRYTMASLGDWDWRPSLADVTAPTLVLHGTADPLPLEGARDWARALPNARLLVLDGVGHFPYLEAPERFFSAVTDFVGEDWPAEARVVPSP
ncbi:MAG: alpha/beta fold hydrolase [Longimicrobiales bacterium]|nr:alpha/beta fold hydrolase [Longimicrobiales bacterium]